MAWLDRQVGRLLDHLDASGLGDRTVVVFSSDHGYLVGEHGLVGKRAAFDEVVRVPLFLRVPGRPGSQRDELVSLIDLLPTLTDLTGIAPMERAHGRSLLPLLEGRGEARDHVYAELPGEWGLVRTRDWKLVLGARRALGLDQLYDLRATAESGLHLGRPYHMAVAGDVDGDGDLDLFCSGYATQDPSDRIESPSFLLLNDGEGRFTPFDQAAPEGEGDPVGPNAHDTTVCGASFADVDQDGRLDLFVGSWYRHWGGDLKLYAAYPDRLYRGLGDGRFQDVTESKGMMLQDSILHGLSEEDREARRVTDENRALIGRGSHKPTYGTGVCDWDEDGDPDLFTLSYGRQWNLHWRNEGARFVEIGAETGFDGDAERSGTYPEDFHPKGRRAELPFRSNGNSFDCTFGDYDNDGDMDCVVGEYTHAWAGESSDVTSVLTNLGKAEGYRFARTTPLPRRHSQKSWNQGDIATAFADLDNDGWMELLVSSCVYPDHNVLEVFRYDRETRRFERITEAIGLDWPDSAQISLSDYDRDGDLDILAGRMPHPSRFHALATRVALFRNDVANRRGHHFLSLRLEGQGEGGANRMAVGARVRVKTGDLVQTREITAGRGHVGHQDDTRLVIGLGKATTIDELEIRWNGKGGRIDVFQDLPVDRFLLVREGEAPVPDEALAPDALPEDAPKGLGSMVLVPAGPTVVGYDKGKRFERPAHTVELSAFEIDVYEVTNWEFRRFVRATGQEPPPHWTNGTYAFGRDWHPVTNIRWEDAVAYATWVGKRLPTEAEWEKACRGPKGWLYPYGNEFRQDITNNGTAPAADTVRVDAFPENKSHYGCIQMAGNVWEFVSDWFSITYYKDGRVDPRGPKAGTTHVSKGGSWTTDDYVCRASFRCRSLPGARWGYCGFRCARSVLPEGYGAPTPISAMVEIPEGEFLMGYDGDYYCAPERKIWLDTYRIDKTPVTNAQYQRFCRETGHATPPHWHAARFPQGLDLHPVINVTIQDARAYAAWAGKVLATEAQWEKAARGTEGLEWPWGNEFDETLCNGRLAGVGYTVPVGTYPKGASPYGVLGMCGNVWEWVEGPWDPSWRAKMPARNPGPKNPTEILVLKGGTWSTAPYLCRTFSRSRSLRGGRWGYCGFRCVADARSHPNGLPKTK